MKFNSSPAILQVSAIKAQSKISKDKDEKIRLLEQANSEYECIATNIGMIASVLGKTCFSIISISIVIGIFSAVWIYNYSNNASVRMASVMLGVGIGSLISTCCYVHTLMNKVRDTLGLSKSACEDMKSMEEAVDILLSEDDEAIEESLEKLSEIK